MKNPQNLAIGVLTATAIILGILLIYSMPDAAVAGSAGRQGDYIVASGRVTGSKEVLYVINVPSQRMIVYVFNPVRGEITPVAPTGMDLRREFGK